VLQLWGDAELAMNSAVAGGAEIVLFRNSMIMIVREKIESRFVKDRGFVIIVIAEGAKPIKDASILKNQRSWLS